MQSPRRSGVAVCFWLSLLNGFDVSKATWTPIGPFSGEADVVATHPATGSLIAASRGGLLFRSADAGDHWVHVAFPGEQMSMIHALLFDPADERRYFAANSPEQTHGNGLYSTGDDGATWQASADFRGKAVWCLAIWPGNPKIMAAGASDGVYLSEDGGGNWRLISPASNRELQPVVSIAFDPRDARVIFAGTPHLPWRTTDGGESWTSIHTGIADDSDVFSIAVVRRNPDRVFASACSGMYRSDNGGRLWTKLKGSHDASYRTYIIVIDPSDPMRVYSGTTSGLQRSLDGGATWQRVQPSTVKSIALDSKNPRRLYAATVSGLLRSDDGGDSFQPVNNGFAGRNVRIFGTWGSLVAVDANDSARRVFASTDSGVSWKAGSGASMVALSRSAGTSGLVVAAEPRALLLSTDDGRSWKHIGSAPAHGTYTSVGMLGGELWAGTTEGMLRGALGGAQWKGSAVRGFEGQRIESLICEGARGCVVAWSRHQASASLDRGITWKKLASPVAGAEWKGLAVDSANGSLLAATSEGLFFSTDGGTSWTEAAGGHASSTATCVLFHPTRPNVAFAAQQGSVLYSTDAGRSWRAMAREGLDGSASVKDVVVLANSPDRIFAEVAGHGVLMAGIEPEILKQEQR